MNHDKAVPQCNQSIGGWAQFHNAVSQSGVTLVKKDSEAGFNLMIGLPPSHLGLGLAVCHSV